MNPDERNDLIEEIMGVMPDELTNEDIACVLMSIIGNYTETYKEAWETLQLFSGAAFGELLQGANGYFGHGSMPYAKH